MKQEALVTDNIGAEADDGFPPTSETAGHFLQPGLTGHITSFISTGVRGSVVRARQRCHGELWE